MSNSENSNRHRYQDFKPILDKVGPIDIYYTEAHAHLGYVPLYQLLPFTDEASKFLEKYQDKFLSWNISYIWGRNCITYISHSEYPNSLQFDIGFGLNESLILLSKVINLAKIERVDPSDLEIIVNRPAFMELLSVIRGKEGHEEI